MLAHELAHVAQQMHGDRSDEASQERTASEAESGRTLRFSHGTQSPPVLRLRAGDVQHVTITLGVDGAAQFELQIEEGNPVTGSGTASGLAPGEYLIRVGRGAPRRLPIMMTDGTNLPAESHADMTIPRAVIRALHTAPPGNIPLTVRSGDADVTTPRGGSGTAGGTPRQRLDALPQRIRNFLLSATGPTVQPEDIPTLLRIADAIRDLSDAELLEYRARAVGATTDANVFERSVMAWLAEVRQRHAAITEEQNAANQLNGQDSLYDLYQDWLRVTNAGNSLIQQGPPTPIGQIAAYEATPFASLHVSSEGSLWQQYYDFRRALDAAGYENIAAFERALQRFLNSFQERAYYIALESLGRYEHFLIEQRARYQDSAVLDELHGRLATAHRQVSEADTAGSNAALVHSGRNIDALPFWRNQQAQKEAQARASVVAATAETDPIASEHGFDTLELARQDRAHIGGFLRGFIDERLGNIRSTRDNLAEEHDLVFQFDALVRTTKQRAGISDGTIWARVIADRSVHRDDPFLAIATTVIILALTFVTAGTGLPAAIVAAGSFGVSTFFAAQSYEEYSVAQDAYGAGMSSNAPWFGWVVIAVAGAGLDLLALGAALRTSAALRAALDTFEATGDAAAAATLRRTLNRLDIDHNLREAIVSGAEARAAERAGMEAGTASRVTETSGESASAAQRAMGAAEETALEHGVHDAARRGGAEVELADGTHGVAVAGNGATRGLYFCSDHCALVADKLDAVLQALPENYPGREVFTELHSLAASTDEALRAGRITAARADAVAARIAADLERLAPHFPGVGDMLNMAPEALRAAAPALRSDIARSLNIRGVHAAEVTENALGGPSEMSRTTGLSTINRPRGSERAGVLSGDIGEAAEATQAGARLLPPTYTQHISAATRRDLRAIFTEYGEDALRIFVDRLELPSTGLRQVEIPVSSGTRRVDRLFREGEQIVLREVKNYPRATLRGTARIREELSKDIEILGRYPYARVDWQIAGNVSSSFLDELRALETQMGGRFRVILDTSVSIIP